MVIAKPKLRNWPECNCGESLNWETLPTEALRGMSQEL